jgi:hypothetical protein
MILEKTYYREDMREGTLAMEKETQYKHEKRNSILCPNIQKPFDNCYCASTSSLYAEATIYYCGGSYKDCEIYAKHAKEGDAKK